MGKSVALLFVVTSLLGLAACENPAAEPYKATPAWSGKVPNMPAPPTLPTLNKKVGDSYTVAGVIHDLHSRMHAKEVTSKEISLVGYIVDSNLPDAPGCALHETGKADIEGCTAPVPRFAIADSKDGKDPKQKIPVMGWARNWAVVYSAMKHYQGKKDAPAKLDHDDQWNVDVPFPLPAVGAKVKVTGTYAYSFGKASTGMANEMNTGILTYSKMEVLEPGTEPAAFKNPPGAKK